MIRVPLTSLVFLYLGVFALVLLIVWLAHERKRGLTARRDLQFRLRCTRCGLDFEDRGGAATLARCPRCEQLNERLAPDPL